MRLRAFLGDHVAGICARNVQCKEGSVKAKALCLVLLCGLFARPVVASPIAVSIDPLSNTVTVGSSFFLDINIADVSDLFGFAFGVSYDPTLLRANSIVEGSFFPAGAGFFIPGDIDNALGSIALSGDALIGEIFGASGSGTLARLNFTALGPGTSTVSLTDLFMLDSAFDEIAGDTQGASVTAAASTTAPIPEPGTMMLFGSGLLAVWRGRRKLGLAA